MGEKGMEGREADALGRLPVAYPPVAYLVFLSASPFLAHHLYLHFVALGVVPPWRKVYDRYLTMSGLALPGLAWYNRRQQVRTPDAREEELWRL